MKVRSLVKNGILTLTFAFFIAVTGCGENFGVAAGGIPAASEEKPQSSPSQEDCDLSVGTSGYCTHIDWVKEPTSTTTGNFLFRFWNQSSGSSGSGPFVTPSPSEVAVELWMPSMGHGSSPVLVKKISEGVYEASQVFFVMPGEWEIRIQLKSQGKVVHQGLEAYEL